MSVLRDLPELEAVRSLKSFIVNLDDEPQMSTKYRFHEQGIEYTGDIFGGASSGLHFIGVRRAESEVVIIKKLTGVRGRDGLIKSEVAQEYKGYKLVPQWTREFFEESHLTYFCIFKLESPPTTPQKTQNQQQPSPSPSRLDDLDQRSIPSQGVTLFSTPMKSRSEQQELDKAAEPRTGPVRQWCWMPRFSGDARILCGYVDPTPVIAQMIIALKRLHDAGLAHMDVKPDNIFLSPTRVGFFLGDFGSVRLFGCKEGSTTDTYLPRDIRMGHYVASPLHDWWMLAMTARDLMTNRTGVESEPDRRELFEWLGTLNSEPALQLMKTICTLVEEPELKMRLESYSSGGASASAAD
ncbi:MAG: hypothetical protein Q7T57_07030 [Dehalococcoidales bacterium]|nr:hypothetical protein [Dehalococcoidales bacterium]